MSPDDFDELETLRRRHAERAVGWLILIWSGIVTFLFFKLAMMVVERWG